MEETQRFLRYVMPGALFLIEALFLLMLLWPEGTAGKIKEFADMKSGGAIAIVSVLGLGALGFFFSIIHHSTRECEWLARLLGGFDHRQVIGRLRSRGILMLFNARNCATLGPEDEPDRHQAWAIVNALWHERVKKDPMIKGANRRAGTLADIVHSIGAARVGSLFAVIIAPYMVYYLAKPSQESSILRFVVIAAILLIIHFYAYWRVSRNAENLISEILEDALTESFCKPGRPVRTFVEMRKNRKLDC
jgi:hypothetical protein